VLDHNTWRQAPEENAMTDTLTPTYRTAPGAVVEESHDSAANWPAIIAGALASVATTLILLAFATGLGLAVISPWADSGVSATTFKWGSGALMLLMAVMSSAVGGYVAGRLRTKWTGVHTDEVYFRDTAHGFLAWALATVVGVVLLASAASTIIGGAASGAGQAAGTAVQNAGPLDGYVDTLLRSDPAANRNPADPAATRAELTRLMTKPLRTGEITAADRTYAAQVIAARTGIPQQEAEARITQTIAQAKEAAETARKAAMKLALWLAATLLAGAFAASLAATEGGGLRDGTWKRRVS
jgi:hypothetical protein